MKAETTTTSSTDTLLMEAWNTTATFEIGDLASMKVPPSNIPSAMYYVDLCPDCASGNSHGSQACPCGHTWMQHGYHDCSICNLRGCFPLTEDGKPQAEQPESFSIDSGKKIGLQSSFLLSHCKGCEEGLTVYYSLPHSGAEINSCAAEFGLDPSLHLPRAAADFYLLLEMTFGGSKTAQKKLDSLLGPLSEQLCLYLEMASLGELRHGARNVDDVCECEEYAERYEEEGEGYCRHMDAFEAYNSTETAKLLEALLDLRGSRYDGDWRMASWGAWKELRSHFGMGIYELMSDYFRNGPFDGSIGGESWANIVDVTEKFRRGELSKVLFVDTCFGLKHNNNIAFDKFWSVNYVVEILNEVRIGNMGFVEHFSSDPVRKSYRRWANGKETKEKKEAENVV